MFDLSDILDFTNTLDLVSCRERILTAEEAQQSMTRNYLAKKLEKTVNTEQLSLAQQSLKKQNTIVHFLKFCEKRLVAPHETNQFIGDLALDYAYQELESSVELMQLCLRMAPKKTVAYYEKIMDASTTPLSKKKLIIFSQLIIDSHLEGFASTLATEPNPLAITHIATHYIDKPAQFAAFILWLLSQNIAPEIIIQTGLLHQFTQYHFFNLDDAAHPFSFFYELLSLYPSANQLVTLAKKTACKSSGLFGFEKYSLLGEQSDHLETSELISLPSFTKTPENITCLLKYFPEETIGEMIRLLAQPPAEPIDDYLLNHIKKHHSAYLPRLIENAIENESQFLSSIAQFVDESLFQAWLESREWRGLFLLSVYPHWSRYFTQDMLEDFLKFIAHPMGLGKEIQMIHLLLTLYEATLNNPHPTMNQQLYESLFKTLMNHAYLLDDQHVFHVLSDSPHLPHLSEATLKTLKKELNDKTVDFLSRHCSYPDYIELQQHWRLLLIKAEYILSLDKRLKDFPCNELELFIHIFSTYQSFASEKNWENLIESLELETLSQAYQEKLYKQLIARIDDVNLRRLLMVKLDISLETLLEEEELVNKAVEHDNLSLLSVYLNNYELTDDMMSTAIQYEQWSLIKKWIETEEVSTVSSECINTLFLKLVDKGDLTLVKKLTETPVCRLEKRLFSFACIKAAENDNLPIFLYLCKNNPEPRLLKIIFATAFKHRSMAILNFFKTYQHYCPQVEQEVTRAFNTSLKKGDLEMIQMLMQFTAGHAPNKKLMAKAKEMAMEKKDDTMLAVLTKRPSANSLAVKGHLPSRSSFSSTDSFFNHKKTSSYNELATKKASL